MAGPPELFRGGQALRAWILAGGRVERQPPGLGLRLAWNAYWFERHVQHSARLVEATTPIEDPVFIVGLWRVGSTRLHERLAALPGLCTPRTWQCFSPATQLLVPAPPSRELTRPMDRAVIGTHSPQEDEFAALLLGEPSVYRGFVDPRRLDELGSALGQWATDPGGFGVLSDRWISFLQAVVQQAPGRLLLKSPNHTFRLPWLIRRFPAARFIWITRDIAAVRASNLKMWQLMVGRYGLWTAGPGTLERFIDGAIRVHDEILAWARPVLGARLTEVRYEDVVGEAPLPPALDWLTGATRAP